MAFALVGGASLILVLVALVGGPGPSRGGGHRGAVALEGVSDTAPTMGAPTTTTAPPQTTAPTLSAPGPVPAAPRRPATTTTAPTPTTSTTPAATPDNGSDCGGQPTVGVDGQLWQCTFDDEFNGTSLDASKWTAQQTANSGYHSGPECFMDDPANVSESGGTLNLTAEQTAPFTCDTPFLAYQTQYTSGMVSTYQHFSQAFGLFEVRAKDSGTTEQGLQSSFWLYPETLSYGAWPASGEIDIAELFSEYPQLAIPYLHYNGSSSDPDATNDHCVIGDPGQFHTYAVEWTPSSMSFLYDGATCLTDHWNPQSPLENPAPFDRPFFICLTQALGITTNSFVAGSTPLPATTSVDWVRVWGAPS
ncbi:MAG TPA: glycoside hydrolase family 16 protein [Acidimicrobiales bacterium]|nr:glycoside hydrolase family 16 protein [Acidimicrobiales bacterium]